MKDKIQEEGKHKGSAIFLKKIGSGTQWPKIRLERGIDARKKKVLERRSGLRPSEKKLLEQRSITKMPLHKGE
jgi:hypothetical protein